MRTFAPGKMPLPGRLTAARALAVCLNIGLVAGLLATSGLRAGVPLNAAKAAKPAEASKTPGAVEPAPVGAPDAGAVDGSDVSEPRRGP